MSEMDNLLEWVKTLLSFAGPIFVVLATAWTERRRKSDAEVRRLEGEVKAKQEQELKASIDALSAKIVSVETNIAQLEKSIKDLQKFDEGSQEDIGMLSQYYQLNSRYVHEVAKLLMTLAEGMRDKHLDGNITQAIAAYHQFEQKTLSTLMSAPPIDD